MEFAYWNPPTKQRTTITSLGKVRYAHFIKNLMNYDKELPAYCHPVF